MNDYIFFMHDDVGEQGIDENAWEPYFARLRASGRFDGGSEIGAGECVRKSGAASTRPLAAHLTGYIRVRANGLDDAKTYLVGNPVFEAGGTVEIRELPKS